MARLSRFIAFILGGICAAYAAGALFLLATWDGARVRNELVLELRERCERELTMEGLPRLHFVPWPTLIVEGVALGEPAGPAVAARASRIEARLALWALVAGRIEITRLGFVDPEVRLGLRPDGRTNLTDLFENGEGRAWPAKFALESLDIDRGKLDLLDANGEPWLKLERVGLAAGPLKAGARGELRGEATLIHGPGDASGGVEFSIGYLPGPQGYDLESARLRFRGAAWGATALDTEVAIQGGHGNIGEALTLARLSLRGHGRFGLRTLNMNASAERLSGQNGVFALHGLKGNFIAASGDERLEAVLESPDIATHSADFSGAPLRAAFSSRSTTRHSEGRLAGRIAYRSETRRFELEGLALQWKLAAPRGKTTWAGSANGRAEFAPTGEAAAVKLQGSFAGMHGKFGADYDEARPVPLQIQADTDSFDPARLANASGFASLPEFAASLSSQAFDARLRVANLALHGLRASHVSTDLSSGGGRLRFSDLDLDAYGGSLTGSLEYQPAARRLLLDQRLSRINLAPLLADLKLDLPLRGELDGAWQLAATPGPWHVVSQSLGGSVQLALRKAQWQGMDIAEFLRVVRPALKNRHPAERIAVQRERQEFNSLALDCDLAGGNVDCANFSASNDWLNLAGAGRFEFGGALDWRARISILTRGIPRDLAGLRGVVVPVHLGGPLHRPLWTLDWKAVPPRTAAGKPASRPIRVETPSTPTSAPRAAG
jgi:uncharacterized protein involved in outer membrane biogenesis